MAEELPGPSQRAEFLYQALAYLENQLSGDEFIDFQNEMAADPAKQDLFVEFCLTRQGVVQLMQGRAEYQKEIAGGSAADHPDSSAGAVMHETMIVPAIQLRESEDEPEEIFAPQSTISLAQPPTPWWRTKLGRAAAILLPLGAGFLIWHLTHGPTQQTIQPQAVIPPSVTPFVARPLAMLGVSIDAQWDRGSLMFQSGDAIAAGPHSLDHGVAQINLAGGAQVVLQSPIRFEVQSDSRVRITQGQLSANVPHGSHGLTVETPDVDAVDLGTEFGVNVIPSKPTHLEVFVGQIKAMETTGPDGLPASVIVNANQAVSVKTGSAIKPDVPVPLSFVRTQELSSLVLADGETGMARWQAFSQMLRSDPDLVAYYPFDNQSQDSKKLLNRSLVTSGSDDGTLGLPAVADSSPQWVDGRWPGKGALQFGDTPESVVRFPNSRGELTPTQSLTYAFWMQRTELTKPIHLFTESCGKGRCFGISLDGTPPAWKSGQPNGLYFNFGPDDTFSSNPLPAESRWMLVAITMGPDSLVKYYVDGKLIGSGAVKIPSMQRSEDLWLGRSNPADLADYPTDIFHGKLDELAIFRRVLSDAEIQRIYDAGKP